MDSKVNEIEETWKIKSCVENRTFGWIHRFLEIDIVPTDPILHIVGWIAGRWTMHQALLVSIILVVTLSILCSVTGFRRALHSWKQAGVSVILILLSIIWTRGIIGILWLCGIYVQERVYNLLSYANCVVQGVSFSLHKFEAYNEARESGLDRHDSWESTTKTDRLITRLTAISVGGFASLYWSFGIRPIVDMAIASAVGILCLLLFSRYLLPALYISLTRSSEEREVKELGRIGKWVTSYFVHWPLERAIWVNTRYGLQRTALVMSMLMVVLVTWAVCEVNNLQVVTRALEFINGTNVHKSSKIVNRPGYLGFDPTYFLLEPGWETDGPGIHDPRFLAMVSQLEKDIRKMSKQLGIYQVYTVVSSVEKISFQKFGKKLPETSGQAGSVFRDIGPKMPRAIRSAFYYQNGVRLVVTNSANDSKKMKNLRQVVSGYTRRHFPELRIHAFGRSQLYPEVDEEVRVGTPVNSGSDQGLISFVFLVWLGATWWRWRKIRATINPIFGALVLNTPTLFATAGLVIIMVHTGLPLDVATAVISALTINATSDFSFYFLEAFQGGLRKTDDVKEVIITALKEKGPCIIEDAFLNLRCFLPLCGVWRFVPIQRVGLMMCIMLIFCLIGTLFITPTLLGMTVSVPKNKPEEGEAREEVGFLTEDLAAEGA